jgi:hypothetical protein
MSQNFVKSRETPLAFEAAAVAMHSALVYKLGWGPSRPLLALALARTALETERWQALCDHNWGNVRAGESYASDYCVYPCSAVVRSRHAFFIPEGELDTRGGHVVGKVWLVPPGHPCTRFRSYGDAVEGALAYLEFVFGDQRDAWGALLHGDAVATVRALKARGYFAGQELGYARHLVALTEEFTRRLARLPVDEVPVPSRDDVTALLALDPEVAASLEAEPDEPAAREREVPRRASHVELIASAGGDASDVDVPSSEPPGRVA